MEIKLSTTVPVARRTVTWKLQGFRALVDAFQSGQLGRWTHSPVFSMEPFQFSLCFHPYGGPGRKSNFVGLGLALQGPEAKSQALVQMTLGIECGNFQHNAPSGPCVVRVGKPVGVADFAARHQIVMAAANNDDTITITASIGIIGPAEHGPVQDAAQEPAEAEEPAQEPCNACARAASADECAMQGPCA